MIDWLIDWLIDITVTLKKNQIDVLNNMFVLLEKFGTNKKNNQLWWEIFFFFDSKLDSLGKNPNINLLNLNKIDLCNIWTVRNTKPKWFIFAQKHPTCFIQHRLDYMFISNTLQELTDTDSYFNRLFSCTVFSFKRKRLSQM